MTDESRKFAERIVPTQAADNLRQLKLLQMLRADRSGRSAFVQVGSLADQLRIEAKLLADCPPKDRDIERIDQISALATALDAITSSPDDHARNKELLSRHLPAFFDFVESQKAQGEYHAQRFAERVEKMFSSDSHMQDSTFRLSGGDGMSSEHERNINLLELLDKANALLTQYCKHPDIGLPLPSSAKRHEPPKHWR